MPQPAQNQDARSSFSSPLYEPLDVVQVRAPLFPVEAYLALAYPGKAEAYGLHPGDQRVQRALAAGSLALLDELERGSSSPRDRQRSERKLLRYLIRMATRPTPYGLFAGVALARFGARTDLALAEPLCSTHTRPDMAWLLQLVRVLESRPEIRRCLRFVANTAAYVRRGRIFLLEPLPGGTVKQTEAVSLRATGVAKRALALARRPVAYTELAEALLASTPGATPAKVDGLITTLWEHSLLISELRPPLTSENPAAYLKERLAQIPPAAPVAEQLAAYLEAIAAWDASGQTEGAAPYRALVEQTRRLTALFGPATGASEAAEETRKEQKSSVLLQVDTVLHLASRQISATLKREIAQAADLMLRLSPLPEGFRHIQAYRQAFLERYGEEREVPLLEMLDTQFGLGVAELSSARPHRDAPASAQRAQELSRLALSALYEKQRVIHLSEESAKRLEIPTGPRMIPTSLDISAFIAASSAEAVDRGEYLVVIGPNVGALQAGRTLGRFASLLGEEARQELALIAAREALLEPGHIQAELVYHPREDRMANVTIRPAVRSHELVYGVMPGVEQTQVIPLDELVVGVRDGRFYLRWPEQDREVRVRAGHMLNTVQAPALVKLLSEIGQDGVAIASNFHWEECAHFPFLPRIQVGRLVLALARWRISSQFHLEEFSLENAEGFLKSLESWREHWRVPRYVYLSQGDNRLLLDLTCPAQAEELRTILRLLKQEMAILLEEALPAPEHAWMSGPGGHYLTECVFSLVRRTGEAREETSSTSSERREPVLTRNTFPATSTRLLPPGSEWLFVKLYCAPTLQEELIASPLRTFAREMLEKRLARDWFFIRYSDPDPHIRLRFQGNPQLLVGQLLPELCRWATDLMTEGACVKFVLDVYDREIERYGGPQSILAAEVLFCADSAAVAEIFSLLRQRRLKLEPVILAVLSANALLEGLGLSQAERLEWCRQVVASRKHAGTLYRERSAELRSLLGDPLFLPAQAGGEQLAAILATRDARLVQVARSLSEASDQHVLTQPLTKIYRSFVHMHCNRLLGIDREKERQVLELLLRTLTGLEKAPARPLHASGTVATP